MRGSQLKRLSTRDEGRSKHKSTKPLRSSEMQAMIILTRGMASRWPGDNASTLPRHILSVQCCNDPASEIARLLGDRVVWAYERTMFSLVSMISSDSRKFKWLTVRSCDSDTVLFGPGTRRVSPCAMFKLVRLSEECLSSCSSETWTIYT